MKKCKKCHHKFNQKCGKTWKANSTGVRFTTESWSSIKRYMLLTITLYATLPVITRSLKLTKSGLLLQRIHLLQLIHYSSPWKIKGWAKDKALLSRLRALRIPEECKVQKANLSTPKWESWKTWLLNIEQLLLEACTVHSSNGLLIWWAKRKRKAIRYGMS